MTGKFAAFFILVFLLIVSVRIPAFSFVPIKHNINTRWSKLHYSDHSVSQKQRNIKSAAHALSLIRSRNVSKVEVTMYVEALLIHDLRDYRDSKTWNELLQTTFDWKLFNYALKVFDRMIELRVSVTSNSITQLITKFCERGKFDSSLHIIDQVLSVGINPSIHHFLPLLRTSASASRAKKVLQRMEYAGLEINVISYTAAIKSCEVGGDWKSALELLDLMRTVGIQPNEITYCCVISVASKGNRYDVAINLLREMEHYGVAPNELCYGGALTACSRCNNLVAVEMLLDEMLAKDVPLAESVFNSVIAVLRNPFAPSGGSLGNGKSYYNTNRAKHWTRSSAARTSTSASTSRNTAVISTMPNDAAADSDQMKPWERVTWLVDRWGPQVVNTSENFLTMAMDVLEGYSRGADVVYLYKKHAEGCFNSPSSSRSLLRFVMHACVSEKDVDSALMVLKDAKSAGLDTPSMYNMTTILCDYEGRHAEAIGVLLSLVQSVDEEMKTNRKNRENNNKDSSIATKPRTSSVYSAYATVNRSKMPPVWITRKVISNALVALTRNFSTCFTEIVDGRLGPSADVQPFVHDLTKLLKYTVLDRRLYLSAASYPMANKLLLDAEDLVTMRALLNHTLYMEEVNSTRLYDFAVRGLVRTAPLRSCLSAILLLMGDLCDGQYYDLAGQIFIYGLKLVCEPLSELSRYHGKIRMSTGASAYGAIDTANSVSASSSSEYVYRQENRSQNANSGSASLSQRSQQQQQQTREKPMTRAQKRTAMEKCRRSGRLLSKYFSSAHRVLGSQHFPRKAYRMAAHGYKYARMPDLMLDVYRVALQDNRADKQLKNLVVFNLARSQDYWDSALEILAHMQEKPDLFMYTSALLACENGRDWEQAIFILDEIQRQGYNLTTVAVTSAIAACAACGRAEEALQLLDLMASKKIPRNVWTFNAVIAACSKSGRWRDALRVFETMRETLSSVTTVTAASRLQQDSEGPITAPRTQPTTILSSNKSSVLVEKEENAFKLPIRAVNDVPPSVAAREAVASRSADPQTSFSSTQQIRVPQEPVPVAAAYHATSNHVTINSLIEVLASGGQELLADEVYREAVSQQVVRPFQDIQQGTIDLHFHSAHMAKSAIRLAFQTILESFRPPAAGNSRGGGGGGGGGRRRSSPKINNDDDDDHSNPSVETSDGITNGNIMYKFRSYCRFLAGAYSSVSTDPAPTARVARSRSSSSRRERRSGGTSVIGTGKGAGKELRPKDLVLIVGQGQKLQDTVMDVLENEFNPPITAYVAKGNSGRLIVSANSLYNWLVAHGSIR